MSKLMKIGIVGALTFGMNACSGSGEGSSITHELRNMNTGIEVEPVRGGEIYERPNAINDPKKLVGNLELGKKLLAVCYYESATLGVDSIGLANKGYAFIYDDATSPEAVFNVSGEELHAQLPACEIK